MSAPQPQGPVAPLPEGPPAFLIVGSPRSGTTLVQRLATELPGVGMPPETHFFDLFLPDLVSRGAPPYDATRIRDEVGRWAAMPQVRGVQVDPEAVVDAAGGRCERVLDLFSALLRAIVPDAATVGEKTPGHLFHWRALLRAQPALRFVAVVRDPRAVVASTMATPWSKEMFHRRWGKDVVAALALRWCLEQRQVRALARQLGAQCLVLHYEDVVTAPRSATTAIGSLIGLPLAADASASPTDLAHGGSDHAFVLPWEDWKHGVTGAIRTDRVEAWRQGLSTRQQRVITGICAADMEVMGYPLGRGARAAGAVGRAGLHPLTKRRLRQYGANMLEFQHHADAATL